MSRITLFSLLLALMLALGINMWASRQVDACTPYLSGNARAQNTEWTFAGSHRIEISCNDWIDRQPLRIQILCLLDAAVVLVFILNALSDLQQWLAARRRMRGVA